MKKVLLFVAAVAVSTLSFAQKGINFKSERTNAIHSGQYPIKVENFAAKGTAVGDTIALSKFGPGDTAVFYIYNNDTGMMTGLSAWGDKAFAERFDVNPADSTMQVIGVGAQFTGTYMPTSTKTVNLKVWSEGAKTTFLRPTLNNSGLPGTELATVTRNINQLGIATTSGAPDTIKYVLFATPTAMLNDNFFVGYTCNYTPTALAGDTICVATNQDGERNEPFTTTLTVTDTTINNVNAVMDFSGAWNDMSVNLGLFANLMVFPIVKIGPGTSMVHGVTRKDFTFFGAYPNPASNSTNVKVAITNAADVTIEIADMSGRNISTSINSLNPGEHTIAVNTSALASGQYLCIVRTSTGNAIATLLTIAK